VSILSHTGELLARLCVEPSNGTGAGQFISPHGIEVDSHGDIYVGEVAWTGWANLFGNPDRPSPLRALQKLVKLSEGS
jgi:hypothetical protein